MNVLVLGGGGREHTLSYKIAQSNLLDKLYVGPGNAGTHKIATNADIDTGNFEAVANFALNHHIEMVIPGPEAPLVAGIKDFFASDEKLQHISVIGPSKKAAQLEGSKNFAKEFMKRHQIPTAAHLTVDYNTKDKGDAFIQKQKAPFVLKADGLAGGKGVSICHTPQEAHKELDNMLSGKFGEASKKVLLEEYLDGTELSVFVLTDGRNYLWLPEAKDYKRIGEHNTGPNTGGMGAVSPVPFANAELQDKIKKRIVEPTIAGINNENLDYTGFIFFGLMVVNGEPYVVEYNCRMGDPEAEVVIPRINNDLLALFRDTTGQKLSSHHIEISKQAAVAVMIVSGGYPGKYEKGIMIRGLKNVQHATLFHAGTKIAKNKIVTNGGRILAVTVLADSLKNTISLAYNDVRKIMIDKAYYRHDIGFDL